MSIDDSAIGQRRLVVTLSPEIASALAERADRTRVAMSDLAGYLVGRAIASEGSISITNFLSFLGGCLTISVVFMVLTFLGIWTE